VKYLFLAAALAATPAMAQVSVEDAWARATPPGAKIAAGYLTIKNQGASADHLISISSPAAERVETHITVHEGGVARMREVKGYDVPAGGSLELKPAGSHLMFVNIKAPFKQGETIPATLRFQKAGEVKALFRVAPLTATEHHGH
jgi:periplasmic copper chaperone A